MVMDKPEEGNTGRITTVLFDLDGTLLDVDVEAFFPAYFDAVAARVSRYIEPDQFIPRLMRSTMAMINNLDASVTNAEAFAAAFFDGLDVGPEVLMPVFEAFYREEFPKLRCYAKPVEGAREVVRSVIDSGRRAVIATSPVFPEVAIRERLRWAGLEDLPFALITTYENMHFCKPHRQYYEEIVSHLGCQASECLMVGNDVEEDLAAQDVGIATYLVEPNIIHRGKRPCTPDHRGPLADVPLLLDGREHRALIKAPGRDI